MSGAALLTIGLFECMVAAQPQNAQRTLDDFPNPPSDAALEVARTAHHCAVKKRKVQRPIVTLIDYTLPSTTKRLWVLNLDTNEVLMHERVTHGKNSGWNQTELFSNRPNSLSTSLGVFRVAEPYKGKHGRSLRLDGLERGFNHNARRRAIVIHGAKYAKKTFRHPQHGVRLGRSFGCPAVRPKAIKKLIPLIKNKTLLVGYSDDKKWLKKSKFLHCGQDKLTKR